MNRFRGVARLARVVDPRGDGVLDRLVEVVGAEDDERVGAAELEHDLLQIPAGDLGDGGAGALGAGDGDAADARIGDHPLDLLVRGVDVHVRAVGEAGVEEHLRHRLGRLRALGRVLQQDRVADDQVRPREAGDLVVGEVPRHDPQQDAERAAADDGRPLTTEELDRLVRHQRFRIVGVELVDRRAEVDLAARLPDRLAHLGDDDLRELLPPFGVQLADAPHERGAIGDGRTLRPFPVRPVGAGDRVPQLVVGDRRVLLDRLAGRGVDNCVHARHFAPPWVGSCIGKRTTGLEPATLGLGSQCSTN